MPKNEQLTPDPPDRRGSEDEKARHCPMCGAKHGVGAVVFQNDTYKGPLSSDEPVLCYNCWQWVRGPLRPYAGLSEEMRIDDREHDD